MDPSQPAASAPTSTSTSTVAITQREGRHDCQQGASAGEKFGRGSVEEQLQLILREAEQERDDAERAARMHGWGLTVASRAMYISAGARIAIGVVEFTTGQLRLEACIAGLLVILISCYQLFVEPKRFRSLLRADQLKSFIIDLQAFLADHGRSMVVGPETEARVAYYRRWFLVIMGNTFEASEVAGKAEDGWRWTTFVEKGKTEMSMA